MVSRGGVIRIHYSSHVRRRQPLRQMSIHDTARIEFLRVIFASPPFSLIESWLDYSRHHLPQLHICNAPPSSHMYQDRQAVSYPWHFCSLRGVSRHASLTEMQIPTLVMSIKRLIGAEATTASSARLITAAILNKLPMMHRSLVMTKSCLVQDPTLNFTLSIPSLLVFQQKVPSGH